MSARFCCYVSEKIRHIFGENSYMYPERKRKYLLQATLKCGFGTVIDKAIRFSSVVHYWQLSIIMASRLANEFDCIKHC